MTLEELDTTAVFALIRKALEEGPLYTKRRYKCARNPRILPGEISTYCPTCMGNQNWELVSSDAESKAEEDYKIILSRWEAGSLSGVIPGKPKPPAPSDRGLCMKATYECKNCRPKEGCASQIWIAYNWISTTNSSDDDSIYHFQRIGQFPPPTERIDPEVELELGDEMRLYANAIRLYNFGLGLGSMAYLRRVVENRMNHILDLLIKVAEDSEAEDSAQIVKELNKQKQARSFSDKAEYAAQVWPNLLKVKGGHNTIKLLYDRLSEGIHDWSDKSCLENFQPIREAFEFTVRQLRNKINSDEEAAQIFGKFSSRI